MNTILGRLSASSNRRFARARLHARGRALTGAEEVLAIGFRNQDRCTALPSCASRQALTPALIIAVDRGGTAARGRRQAARCSPDRCDQGTGVRRAASASVASQTAGPLSVSLPDKTSAPIKKDHTRLDCHSAHCSGLIARKPCRRSPERSQILNVCLGSC